MEGVGRHHSGSSLLLKFRPQFFILERQHPTVGVIDDDEFLGAQKLVRNDQRSQRIFGHDAPGVANDVGFSGFEAFQDQIRGEEKTTMVKFAQRSQVRNGNLAKSLPTLRLRRFCCS
jgi:hypothetical protein